MDKKPRRIDVRHGLDYGIGALWLLAWAIHILHPPVASHPTSGKTVTYRANGAPSGGRLLLSSLKGTGSARSPFFEAPAHWHVYWSFMCDDENQTAAIRIAATSSNGQVVGSDEPIAAQGISGFGDQPYSRGGLVYLTITATGSCHWQISAKTL